MAERAPRFYAWLTGIFASVAAVLMVGAIRWGVPAYAEEIVDHRIEQHVEYEEHEKQSRETKRRLDRLDKGIKVLLQRTGGPPSREEIQRAKRDWLEDLE